MRVTTNKNGGHVTITLTNMVVIRNLSRKGNFIQNEKTNHANKLLTNMLVLMMMTAKCSRNKSNHDKVVNYFMSLCILLSCDE